MKIRGKEYMEVKDRVMVFRKNHPSWALITEIIENNEATGSVIFKVIIEDENGRIRGTGHAHEFKEDKTSMVNKTSHLENCETSAIGRALASLGIGIESSYATYDEVKIAIDKGERAERDGNFDSVKAQAVAERKAVKEGTIRQTIDAPLEGGVKSGVKVIEPSGKWKDHMLHKGKFEGKTLGEIAKIPAKGKDGGGLSYLKWMSGLEIQDDSLRTAIDACIKELDGNGKQGFEQVG
jgi:hypothetical protein